VLTLEAVRKATGWSLDDDPSRDEAALR